MKALKLLAVLSAMLCAIPPVRSADLQGPPAAMIDLATTAGARSVQGRWRYDDVRIVETGFRDAEPGELSVYRDHSGYAGPDIAEYGQPGSNGLTLDPQGRLTINEHDNHRVTRLERDGRLTVLAASYEGRRLNTPNDLVYRSDGALYFTDPPFGLPKFFDIAGPDLCRRCGPSSGSPLT